MKALFVFLFLFGFSPGSYRYCFASAGSVSASQGIISEHSFCSKEVSFSRVKPNLLYSKIKKWLQRTKRITAAVLAFPLPFGAIALHRIYLGTKPYVPVVYIATVGGIVGILPFIDFCVLLLEKDAERFNNNHKVFMWIK